HFHKTYSMCIVTYFCENIYVSAFYITWRSCIWVPLFTGMITFTRARTRLHGIVRLDVKKMNKRHVLRKMRGKNKCQYNPLLKPFKHTKKLLFIDMNVQIQMR